MDARRSASEVVKEAEAALTRAAAIRAEARRLLETAECIEIEARSAAVLALGEAHGGAAFSLALLSFPDAAASLRAVAVDPAASVIATVASSAVPTIPPTAALTKPSVPAPVEEPPPGRTSLWGVDVPSSRIDEARALVDEATAMAAQGKKGNPYATDRGKNAWRRSLFTSVIERLGNSDTAAIAIPSPAGGSSDGLVPVVPPSRIALAAPEAETVQEDVPVAMPHVRAEAVETPDESPAVPAVEQPADEAVADDDVVSLAPSAPKSDPLDDDLPDEPFKSHPVTNRRAGYGNPVPKPPGLAEAQARTTGTGLRPVRRPPFVR